MTYLLTYVEIDIPAFVQNSPPDSPEPTTTMRFAVDTDYLPNSIECIASIDKISFMPATLSLGQNLGQRASLTVTFKDHQHVFAGEAYDSGTFWGKFRARYGLKLNGRPLRLIRGELGQALADMETHHFIIDSTDGPNDDGYKIIAKDVLKLADDSKAQAPQLSNGFLASPILVGATSLTLSPTGIGDAEYPASGYGAIAGKEIVAFTRDPFTKLIIKANGSDGSTTFVDSSPIARIITATGAAQIDTAQFKFGGSSALLGALGNTLTMGDSDDWALGNGNFTIKFWIRFTTAPSGAPNSVLDNVVFFQETGGGTNRVLLGFDGTDILFIAINASVTVAHYTATHGIPNGTWVHFEVVRSGSSFFIFKNAVALSLTTVTAISTNTLPNIADTLKIGGTGVAGPDWIDDFVWRKGIADHTSNFTVPTAEPEIVGSGDVLMITRAQFNTTDQAHSAQDRFQLCLHYNGIDPANIIYDLLVTYALIPSSFIPLVDWLTETTSYLGIVYTALIAEPTGVNKLCSELIEQMAGAMWWDDINQQIRLQILRAIPTTADVYDEENTLAESYYSTEQGDKRLTEVQVYFAKNNPLLKDDQDDNYRCTAKVSDDDAVVEYGNAVIKKIRSRWIASGGRTSAETLANKHLGRYRDPPRRFEFDIPRAINQDPSVGAGYQLGSKYLQDTQGNLVNVPIQVVRVNPDPDKFLVEAEEMLWTPFGGDIDPTTRTITFEFDEYNINLRTRHDELFSAPQSGDTVIGIINAGVTIGSTSTSLRAFDMGTWPGGVTLILRVRGRIQGKGGAGGNGENVGVSAPTVGAVGGIALYSRVAFSLDFTTGGTPEIFGGGGGGGGGGGFNAPTPGCGGGGGSGTNGGELGIGPGTAPDGSPGTRDAGGAGGFYPGGPGSPGTPGSPGAGGIGGGPGLNGQNGQVGTSLLGAAGGLSGASIDGISFAVVTGSGDVRGPQVN